jgi:hypothetical protein
MRQPLALGFSFYAYLAFWVSPLMGIVKSYRMGRLLQRPHRLAA